VTARAARALPGSAGALVVAALCLVASLARSADELPGRVQVQQKIRLVARLLADVPALTRITHSGNAQAVANLDESRVHHALAEDQLARGDLPGALQSADEALRHLGVARRLVPDVPAQQALARQRHEQRAATVERLIEAWRQRAAGLPPTDATNVTAAMELVARSRQQAGEGRHDEATQSMAAAEHHMLEGMQRVLQSTTLDYTQRPATPTEEFQFELARHRGLAELVPLALRDLKPRADIAAMAERYVDTSSALRTQAQQQYQAGDVTRALGLLRNAILYVQRALAATGVVAPTESAP
jgi:tetratricopeptide (TPR) repeat protein